ncbi:MAG: hypothetical protein ABIJ65_04240 [Chloroflexota bacterium]
MQKSLNSWLVKNAKGWLILVFMALFLLFSLVVMPFGQTWLGGNPPDVGSIDLTFGASPAALFNKVEDYGTQGRNVYRIFALTADIAYPIIYSIFLGLAITFLLQRTFPLESKLQKLNLLPFAALLFDVLENLGIAALLSTFPQKINWLALFTIIVNFIKWVFAGGSTLLVLVGLIGWLVVSIGRRSDK